MGEGLRVGACQTPEILGDVDAAVACIERFARQADRCGVDVLLFPECLLQGYLVEPAHVSDHALELGSGRFTQVLRRLEGVAQTLVFGVIEQQGSRYFNTAVVAANGGLVGVYRKTRLVPGEALFDAGDGYPVFEVRGVRSASTSATTPNSRQQLPRWRPGRRSCCSFRRRT